MKVNFEEKHIKWGITIFLVVICSIAVFFIVFRFNALQKVAGTVSSILTPFIYGMVMAYLLCPIYNFTVSHTYGFLSSRKRKMPRSLAVSKGVGHHGGDAVHVHCHNGNTVDDNTRTYRQRGKNNRYTACQHGCP